ncbi:hypothetical protein CPC08DRAFT_819045 [Agrocybe pediades]|nr:hypothetical protein CPC08DRAFT_819045 [Agrocybe pediades]
MPMDRPAIIEAICVMRFFSYIWVSATVFLLCDSLSMLDLEITYIWRSKWTIPKVVYFLLRYYGFSTMALYAFISATVQHSVMRCQLFYWFAVTVGGTLILSLATDLILCIRVYALYDRSTRILWLLVSLYLGNVVLQFYVGVTIGLDAARTAFVAPAGLPLPGCWSNPDPKLNLPALISSVVVTSIHITLLSTAWYRAYCTSREMGMPFRFSPVMKALVRDGIAFFLLRAAIVISFVAMNFVLRRGPLLAMMRPWYSAAYISVGCRLILNIRKVAHANKEALARGDNFVFGGLETSLTISQVCGRNNAQRHNENSC